MIYDISKKILQLLEAEPALVAVGTWKHQEGITNCKEIAVSVGCHDCTFRSYTADKDECNATYLIYIYTPKSKNEEDELIISRLADTVRIVLCEQYAVGGKAAAGFVEKISFGTAADRQDATVAVLYFKVKSYMNRKRPRTDTGNN